MMKNIGGQKTLKTEYETEYDLLFFHL